jgi:putative membrane protein
MQAGMLVVLAHVRGPAAPGDIWHHWASDPLVLLALVASGLAYARGLHTLRARSRGGVRHWRVGCFFAGMLTIAVALLSPLDAMAASLFSAHMMQHLLLMIVAPPLVVLGLPGFVLLWALPRSGRRAVGRWWAHARMAAPLRALWHAVTMPVPAVLVHTAAVWAWHVPALYERAIWSAPVHALEHGSFLTTGIFVSWAALRPRGMSRARRSAGFATGLLVVFATAMQSGALGALLTFARTPWYSAHGIGPALWGISPLEDQQLAGLVMWVPGGLLYTVAAALLFGAWMSAPGRSVAGDDAIRALPSAGVAMRTLVVLVVMLVGSPLLGGCRRRMPTTIAGGDVARGKHAVATFGCGACHTIDGLRGARGQVGPPLTGIAERSMIAGQLPNTPENLVRWLLDPPAVEPGTAMPKLVGDSQTARDIAAYLYTLH